jgi:hypothetical protein
MESYFFFTNFTQFIPINLIAFFADLWYNKNDVVSLYFNSRKAASHGIFSQIH